jgi:lipopolysaccharide/colanic/teichoic acid biosynthesis glycosyltransferase
MGTSEVQPNPLTAQEFAAVTPGERLTGLAYRLIDVVGATALLILCMPLMVGAALAIRLDSPGPVLFRQRRLGRGMKPFTVHKLRTMENGASPESHRRYVARLISGEVCDSAEHGPRFKLASDTRITRIGHWLRRCSVDELPQLWDVLRGEMSLVGPRPAIPYEVEHYPPHWYRRFAVKPGLTGLWQVSGRSNLTMEQMVALDIEFVERRSVWLTIVILARTVPAVLSTRGAG